MGNMMNGRSKAISSIISLISSSIMSSIIVDDSDAADGRKVDGRRMSGGEYRGRRGFSLAEILVAIALIIVLIGISVPAINVTYQDMAITKLDSQARILYMAAQNRFSAYQAAGTLEELLPDKKNWENGAEGTAFAAMIPDGAGSDLGMSKSGEVISLSKTWLVTGGASGESPVFNKLFPTGTIDQNLRDTITSGGGDFVIEVDPSSGSVYGVFYAESTIDYNVDYKNDNNRSHDARKEAGFGGGKALVGYYGGESVHIDAPETIPQIRVSLAELTSGDEGLTPGLAVKVDTGDAELIAAGNASIDPDKWVYTMKVVQVDDETNAEIIERTITEVWDASDTDASAKRPVKSKYAKDPSDTAHIRYFYIDGLDEGYHFAENYYDGTKTEANEQGIIPGSNINIYLTVEQGGGSVLEDAKVKGRTTILSCNSLYGDKTHVSDGKVTAYVSEARHLQNLNAEVSDVHEAYEPWSVIQNAKIDLKDLEKVAVTYANQDIMDKPAQEQGFFVPIFAGKLRRYNGGNNEIRNMKTTTYTSDKHTEVTGGNAAFHTAGGLFSVVCNAHEQSSLMNIRLVNPLVLVKGDEGVITAGSIAGLLWNVNVSNCRVYCEEDGEGGGISEDYGIDASGRTEDWSTTRLGGFAGDIYDCDISNSFVSIPSIRGYEAAKANSNPFMGISVGGFAATVQSGDLFGVSGGGGVIRNCYSNVDIRNVSSAGGFTFYLDNYISAGSDVSAMVVKSCYAVGKINANPNNSAGFCYHGASMDLENCYTAVTYELNSPTEESVQAFVGTSIWVDGKSKYKNCYYLMDGVGIPEHWNDLPSGTGQEVFAWDEGTEAIRGISYKDLYFGKFGMDVEELTDAGEKLGDKFTASRVAESRPYSMEAVKSAAASRMDTQVGNVQAFTTQYPFPGIEGMPHYGNWPLPRKTDEVLALVYYEHGEGEEASKGYTYKVYLIDDVSNKFSGAHSQSTLGDEGDSIRRDYFQPGDWGYFLVARSGDYVQLGEQKFAYSKELTELLPDIFSAWGQDFDWSSYAYPIYSSKEGAWGDTADVWKDVTPGEYLNKHVITSNQGDEGLLASIKLKDGLTVDTAKTASYSATDLWLREGVSNSDSAYRLDTRFAKSVFTSTDKDIRTIRNGDQFQNILYYTEGHFEQERNLQDLKTIEGNFSGHYDGNNLFVRGTVEGPGLFKSVGGNGAQVHSLKMDVKVTGSGGGAIAGHLGEGGHIHGCQVKLTEDSLASYGIIGTGVGVEEAKKHDHLNDNQVMFKKNGVWTEAVPDSKKHHNNLYKVEEGDTRLEETLDVMRKIPEDIADNEEKIKEWAKENKYHKKGDHYYEKVKNENYDPNAKLEKDLGFSF